MKRNYLLMGTVLLISAMAIVYVAKNKPEQPSAKIFRSENLTVQYPQDWQVFENTPEQQATHGGIASFGPTAPSAQPATEESVVLSSWVDINNVNALGGSWVGMRQYRDLQDYLGDTQALKTQIGEYRLDEKTIYEVEIGGMGVNYAIMFEEGEKIYELSFASAGDKSKLTEGQKFILENLSMK